MEINDKRFPNLYSITKDQWVDGPWKWPNIEYSNMHNYLINTPEPHTKESLKTYKLLGAYNFLSCHMQTALFMKLVQPSAMPFF